MQRKVVRFTSHDEVYSPVHSPLAEYSPTNSPPPSPVRSAHPSLPSSNPPLPQLSVPSIHPLLEFKDGHRDNFHFDLSNDPSMSLPMSNPIFQQPAVIPPIASITLICEALPWEIIIHPKPGAAVSVADVFQGLYRSLRRAILHEEYKIEVAQRRFEVDRALEVRRKCPGEDEEDVRRRVDFLMLQHRFLGLSPTGKAGVWKLHVSL